MKIIEAIVKPFKLNEVKAALVGMGVEGMTITDVNGFGHQKGGRERYNAMEYTDNFVPKVKVEVFVEDSLAQRVIDTITRSAQTDSAGDGMIFILDVVSAVRIKTGQMCESALG